MITPARKSITSAEAWRGLCKESMADLDNTGLIIVHTPSARAYVEANFSWAAGSRRLILRNEPSAADFASLDDAGFRPRLVVGIGGGKALDAAKTVACWGTAYASSNQLADFLLKGGRIEQRRETRLILAPSLASSGSEASKAAIVSAGQLKTGLRGAALMADVVVHDERLWSSVTDEVAGHYAFDIFAHLLETTVSLRRSDASLAHAAEGLARLGHWVFRQNASLAHYREAMEASFSAGLCLATSSTCLPHRIQYVLGPATGTTHVEGIWYLSRGWFPLAAAKCPERIEDAAKMFAPEKLGLTNFEAAFTALHRKAAGLVRRERFADVASNAEKLASHVTGDLAADPVFESVFTIKNILTHHTS